MDAGTFVEMNQSLRAASNEIPWPLALYNQAISNGKSTKHLNKLIQKARVSKSRAESKFIFANRERIQYLGYRDRAIKAWGGSARDELLLVPLMK